MSTPQRPLHCRLDPGPPGEASEFVAYPDGLATLRAAGWPCRPGEVRRAPDGAPLLLHIAPRRWLAPAAHPDSLAAMNDAEGAGAGSRVAAAGKWRRLRLSGPDAARALASTVDVTAILEGRDCAATTLFDCPAIIMGAADGFEVWLPASYAENFVAAIARLGGSVAAAAR